MTDYSFIFSSKVIMISTLFAIAINFIFFPHLLNNPDMNLTDLSYLAYNDNYINQLRNKTLNASISVPSNIKNEDNTEGKISKEEETMIENKENKDNKSNEQKEIEPVIISVPNDNSKENPVKVEELKNKEGEVNVGQENFENAQEKPKTEENRKQDNEKMKYISPLNQSNEELKIQQDNIYKNNFTFCKLIISIIIYKFI